MSVQQRRTARAALAGAVGSLLLLTACGRGGEPAASSSPSASPSEEASESPSEPAAGECPTGATCYDFADADADADAEGWPQVNEAGYFAGQDAYDGGSFRFGARAEGLYSVAAPVSASEISSTYAVDLSATITLGPEVPETSSAGLRCWEPDNTPGGFAALLAGPDLVLGVISVGDGAFTEIDRVALEQPLTGGDRARLGLTCVQDGSSGNVEAALAVSVDDEVLIEASYGNGAQNVGWQASAEVGVAVEGTGADAFFDDLVVAPAE